MSDLRGLSRGSKTAAVVVLVVLLQVIVVAVLGLGAISRDRDEGARRDREATRERSLTLARRVVEQTAQGVIAAVDEAAKVALNAGGLRTSPRTGWLAAVREFYRVDAEGRVRAAGGTLLHVPTDVIEATERRADRGALESFERMLSSARSTDPASIEARRRFVTQFPFTVDADGSRYARAVGEALRLAKDVAAADGSPLSVTDAVLLAYETAAVNEHRATATQPGFAIVAAELRALVAGLPEPDRRALGDLLADLDRARAGLVGFLDVVLPLAKDAAAHPAPTRVFTWGLGGLGTSGGGGGVEVVALARLARLEGAAVGEALLVRIDRRAIEAIAASPAVVPEGAAVRLISRDTPVARAAGATDGAVRLAVQRLDFDAALDVVVERAGAAPAGGGGGPRETFYWFILGLATLGVSIAGVVLVRILRREVVLARLKADFVSNLSHELKTTLTSISMFTEMIRDGRLEGDELREGIAVISGESERLQRIVSRMIDVARREAEGTGYALRPADLNTPVRAACERFRRLEPDPGLRLDVELDPGLPPVLLDDGAIDDAVTNLLSNAWKYRRGDAAHVRVGTRRRGRRVELSVADDGIGIPRHERRRVFEMFYRAENYLSRNVPGTGLGLALVRTIVRVHRGKVFVDAAPGGGSVFRVRFPAARGGAARTVARAPAAPAARSRPTDESPAPTPSPARPSHSPTPSAPARTTGERR